MNTPGTIRNLSYSKLSLLHNISSSKSNDACSTLVVVWLTIQPNNDIFLHMKFLKVLINSLISGLFFCILLSLLILGLNINLDFTMTSLIQLTFFLAITYGVLISLFSLLLFFTLQFFLGKKIKIAFISPSFLSISSCIVIFLFLVTLRTNYNYFFSILTPENKNLMQAESIIFGLLAILGLFVCYGFHRYKKNIIFWIYLIFFTASMAFVFIQRSNYPIPSKSEKVANLEVKKIDTKITIIGLEGLSFDFIIPLADEGKLPNFSWFMEEGSWGKLKAFSPSESITLNNSFNTGKFPSKHRQISSFLYRLLYVKKNIEIAPRFILFRQLTRVGLLSMIPNQQVPLTKDIWKIFEGNKTIYLKRDWPYQQETTTPNQKSEKLFNLFFQDLQYDSSEISSIARQSFFRDYEFEEKLMQEKTQTKPQLTYFMLNGLNTVEIYFYKYSFPDLFGDIEQEDLNKYSSIIEKYYQFYDQIIGKYLASLKEDELLLIYSPHGIEPLPLWKRFVEMILGNPNVSAYHELAPEGVVFFYGKGVARGKPIEGMKIIDIAPTLLYYLGLPVGKDMDGIVQSSLFIREFTAENPVFYISSYEEISFKTDK